MVTRKSCDTYLPLKECRHGYLYQILARNFDRGIFDAKQNAFIGIRTKFGDKFLDTEFHWDYSDHYGTAKPIKELEVYPGEIGDEKKMFEWLENR